MSYLTEAASAFAVGAHAGQLDKNGQPYYLHPFAVAQGVTGDTAKAVAYLHDVLEDTKATVHDLRAVGFDNDVIDAVMALTRQPGEGDAYYARVRANPVALRVKMADIAHNTRPDRVAKLDRPTRERLATKYEHALEELSK